MATGTLTLHRFNGDEAYNLKSADVRVRSEESQLVLTLEVDTEEGALQSVPDTVEFSAKPSAEVSVILHQLDEQTLVGQRFVVPAGYDPNTEEYVATLYYYEHQDLDNNVIEMLSRDSNKFHIRWTATTQDVNYYDGSKPDTSVVIDGVFTLHPSSI